ncbi:cysteine-rich CWC family protein [Lysinibacillus sp. NPDC048646]|uniref:cysteine-rich CWC family protein n=1 Tax=Lysinibacillus sp. NPDC048646 TaxID=3390574 RepID=UPI003D027A63
MPNDEKCCPICGEENHCELAEGHNTCWCMKACFPERIFEAVTPESNKCICQKCLNTYKGV